jgi:hypothetical protein
MRRSILYLEINYHGLTTMVFRKRKSLFRAFIYTMNHEVLSLEINYHGLTTMVFRKRNKWRVSQKI